MGRTQLEASNLTGYLHKRIVFCAAKKEELLQEAKKSEKGLNHVIDGKTIREWIWHYDSYLNKYKHLLKEENTKAKRRKIAGFAVLILVVCIVLFALFLSKNPDSSPVKFYSSLIDGIKESLNIGKTSTGYAVEGETQASSEPSAPPSESQAPQETPSSPEQTPTPSSPAETPQPEVPQQPTQEPQTPEQPPQQSPAPQENQPSSSEINETGASQANTSLSPSQTEAPVSSENISVENITEQNLTMENITEANITIENHTVQTEDANISLTISTEQIGRITLGKPAKWAKKLIVDSQSSIEVKKIIETRIPALAENISVKQIDNNQETTLSDVSINNQQIATATSPVTGNFIASGDYSGNNRFESILLSIKRFFHMLWNLITISGMAIGEQNSAENMTLEISANISDNTQIIVNYDTPAPTSEERALENGKQVTIIGPDAVHYEDVLAFTDLEKEAPLSNIHLYHIVNDSKEAVQFSGQDTNENGLIDYIEWNVAHLSNQTYVIELSSVGGTFFEDFESGNFSTNNWVASGPGNLWYIDNAQPYRGTYCAEAKNTDGEAYLDNNISTAGYSNISLSFYYSMSTSFDYFLAQWYNGTNWITALNRTTSTGGYILFQSNLTSAADNNPNFRIRFVVNSEKVTKWLRVDNINITGIPLSSAPSENVTLNASIKDSAGNDLNVTIEIDDNSTNIVYNQTAKKHFKSLAKGNYKLKIIPNNHKIQSIEISNISVSMNITQIVDISQSVNATSEGYYFAINPLLANATYTIIANGTPLPAGVDGFRTLEKCASWNFTTSSCSGSWSSYAALATDGNYYFTISGSDPGFKETVSNCTAEDDSQTSNNFTSACQDPSGSRLILDDSIYEIHSASKQTGKNLYGGVRSQSVNTSITNCINITQVWLCYEWWYTGSPKAGTAAVSISNDTGLNFIIINASNPPATANPGVICQNITANRTWTCQNFFGASGNRAVAEVEIAEGTNPGDQNVTTDVLYFNVTYNSISNPPNATAPPNQTVELGNETTLVWSINGSGGYYYVLRNNVLFQSALPWQANTNIVVVPNTYVLGDWNYTLVYNDTTGATANSTTSIRVVDNIQPTCSALTSAMGGIVPGLPTQANITINGNMNDWAGVLANPLNYVTDKTALQGDPDLTLTDDRDMINFAYTYNSQYLFFRFARAIQGSKQIAMLVYLDYGNDGYMNSTDKVIKFVWSGSNQQYNADLYNYVPASSSGDIMLGDGYKMPGTITNNKSLESGMTGGASDGLSVETRVSWASLGFAGQTPITFKASTANGAGTNLPSQIIDNVGAVLTAKSSYVFFQQSQSKPATNGTSTYYALELTNCGNANGIVDFSITSSQGWTVTLYYGNGTQITDTNSNGLPDVFASSAAYSPLIVKIDVPGNAPLGTVDITNITSISSTNTTLSFTTTVASIAIKPKSALLTGSPNMVLYSPFTVYNYQTYSDNISINASSSQGWNITLLYSNGSAVTDTNADGKLDLGTMLSFDSKNLIAKIQIPSGATAGSVDTTTIRINSSVIPSRSDTSVINTTVQNRIMLAKNYTQAVSPSQSYYYALNITNNWNATEPIEISKSSNLGWQTSFYDNDKFTLLTDTNSNGFVDVNVSGYGATKTIYALINVNSTASMGSSELTDVYANSSSSLSTSSRIRINETVRGISVYNDSALTNLQTSFNLTASSNLSVYIKASNIGDYSTIYFIWYSGNGSIYRQTQNITVISGNANDSISMNINSSLGTWTVMAYNASDNSAITSATFSAKDIVHPSVISPFPSPSSSFAVNSTISIGANITDYGPIYMAIAIITYPNGTNQTLILSNPYGNTYTSQFTIPSLTGAYNVTFYVNDTFGNLNNSIKTNFTASGLDASFPTITLNLLPANAVRLLPNATFTCSATDNTALSNIEFYLDGILRQANSITGTSASTSFDIYNIANGTHNWNCKSYDASSNSNMSSQRSFTINTSAAPTYNKTIFSGNTTDWISVPDITNVCNGTAILDNPPTDKIQWHNCVNAFNANFDVYANLSYNLINITFGLSNTFNSSATLTMRNLPWDETPLVYRDGILCVEPDCSNVSYDIPTGTAVFNVTHFTSYASGGNSQMYIWDETDTGMPFADQVRSPNQTVRFFANYTKKSDGSPITTATCLVNFTDSLNNLMVYNNTLLVYEYSRNFTSTGTFPWNVSCKAPSFGAQATNDTVLISQSQPPKITYVSAIPNTDPNEASFAPVQFNITIYDGNGFTAINFSSVNANFSKASQTRATSSCTNLANYSSNYANFSCTINMWYFDSAGNWNISVSAKDNSNNNATNSSTFFQYNLLRAIVISPSALSFGSMSTSQQNQTSALPTTINNTGNANLTGKIAVQAFNLAGEANPAEFIPSENISVSNSTGGTPPLECSGFTLKNSTDTNVTSSLLEAGNLSLGGGIAQEQLFYCIKSANGISSQSYSTKNSQSWIIKIMLAAFIPASLARRRKKSKSDKEEKGKKENLQNKDSRLIETLELIIEEIKDKYNLDKAGITELLIEKLGSKYGVDAIKVAEAIKRNEKSVPITIFTSKLGGLEAVVKYLKENISMAYSEIADMLNRNDRTIWASYNKAKQKDSAKHEPAKTEIFLPISIFKDRRMTVLEAIIMYLKESGFKHVEIAKLLSRDQRNIWTIYARAKKKLHK